MHSSHFYRTAVTNSAEPSTSYHPCPPTPTQKKKLKPDIYLWYKQSATQHKYTVTPGQANLHPAGCCQMAHNTTYKMLLETAL